MSTDASNPPLERVLSGDEVDMEPLEVRWLHTGSKHLALPTAPITGTDTAYKPFSMDESHRIETAWEELSEERRLDIIAEWGCGDGEMSTEPSSKGAYPTRKEKKDKKKKEKEGEVTSDPPTPGELEAEEPPKDKEEVYKSIMEKARSDPSMLDAVHGVPVGQDSLFEVNIDTLSLHPVFWPQSGPRVPVIRGTWFVENETRPCSWDLAEELEKGYKQVEPWQPAYKDELLAARALGAQGDEKLKYELPERFGGAAVVFEDAVRCRLISSGTLDYLSRAIWSSFGSTTGSYVYRGYTAAAAAQAPIPMAPVVQSGDADEPPEAKAQSLAKSGRSTPDAEKNDPLSESEGQEVHAKDNSKKNDKWSPPFSDVLGRMKKEFDSSQRSLEEQNAPVIRSHDDDKPCTDLVIVIHGIGQHLAAQYESLNFIYAANQFRQVLRKQSADPAAASIMKDRRVQLLPVQWRANLDIESGSAHEEAKKEEDNVFTFNDISLKQAIPQVREVTNSVLLDIPLFMSDHRTQMIEAVCQQANRLYRMWIARHPDFEEYGRVHVVGHSLGSALAAHILSNQPTLVPKVADLPKQAVDTATDRFIFNTSKLFLCGSPLGIFLGLRQSHLLARLGRERTMNAQPDEAQLHPGTFGCMAVDSVYNIFYYTDPVAYALNPTVDVRVAKMRPPLEIPSVTGSFFPSVALPTMPTMPTMPAMPSMPSLPDMSGVTKYLPFGGPSSDQPKSKTPSVGAPAVHEDDDVKSGVVELSEAELLAGTRGERRFAALNPRGSIDFALPAQGLNDYLDMLTAHTNYWTDPNFSAFILNETFGAGDKSDDHDAEAGKSQDEGDKASS